MGNKGFHPAPYILYRWCCFAVLGLLATDFGGIKFMYA